MRIGILIQRLKEIVNQKNRTAGRVKNENILLKEINKELNEIKIKHKP